MKIEVKRVYEDLARAEGYRVLVDRVWPRGCSKEKLKLDEWLRDIAPSNELRKWFNHDPARWEPFQARYRKELKSSGEALARLRGIAEKKPLILLYSAKDEAHNQALVLRDVMRRKK